MSGRYVMSQNQYIIDRSVMRDLAYREADKSLGHLPCALLNHVLFRTERLVGDRVWNVGGHIWEQIMCLKEGK